MSREVRHLATRYPLLGSTIDDSRFAISSGELACLFVQPIQRSFVSRACTLICQLFGLNLYARNMEPASFQSHLIVSFCRSAPFDLNRIWCLRNMHPSITVDKELWTVEASPGYASPELDQMCESNLLIQTQCAL